MGGRTGAGQRGLRRGGLFVYFLPPAGFGIEDPEDWIAFLVFIGTAVVAGELASRAERRAAEAQAGRQEIERLYRELQAAFERASEAEAARRNEELKSALLDALTHNLRTPLTSIKAAVTALIRAGSWTEVSELPVEGRRELLAGDRRGIGPPESLHRGAVGSGWPQRRRRQSTSVWSKWASSSSRRCTAPRR